MLQLSVFTTCLCVYLKSHLQVSHSHGLSEVSIDRYSMECTSVRHKTGNYNGVAVFIKFIERESLTLSNDDILELKLVRSLCKNGYFSSFVLNDMFNCDDS